MCWRRWRLGRGSCCGGRRTVEKQEVAALAGVSRPTVDLWLDRYRAEGIAGVLDRPRGAPRGQVPAAVRPRILAATRISPPVETGLSHWSSREMAAFIIRTDGVYVSHHYVAKLWRENGGKPQRQGPCKVSRGPGVRREGRRCGRALPVPARRRCRAQSRRKNPDPGPG